eukprot:UN32890
MFSPLIPRWLRYVVVVMLLCNTATFLVANTTVGASIGVKMILAGDVYHLEGLYEFTLKNSVQEMWNAGVYPLSILIGLLSGLWPHVKIAMMMVCWALPFPTYDRGIALLWLDALGKWALIDMYVLVLCMAAFYLHISPNEVNYLPDDLVDVYVVTTPGTSMFAFLIGVMTSLICTHIIVHYHRKEEERVLLGSSPKKDKKKQALSQHGFKCRTGFESKGDILVKISYIGIFCLMACLVIAVVLLTMGAFEESFVFEFGGLIAELIDPDASYSMMSVIQLVPDSNDGSLGSYVIYVSFMLFAFAIPILGLALLVILFAFPLSNYLTKFFFVAVEICFAWGSTEVFLVGVIAAMLEINQFAQFLVGDKCDLINKLLPLFLTEGEEVDCFTVATSFKQGCVWLWVSIGFWIYSYAT